VDAQVAFGAGLSVGTDTDLGLGARIKFGLGELTRKSKISGQAGFDYFFPDGFDYWSLTAHGLYNIETAGKIKPYVGGGVGYAHASLDLTPLTRMARNQLTPSFSLARSSLGYGDGGNFFLSLVGGTLFGAVGNVRPYLDGRIEIGEGSQLVVGGGVYFGTH
jgi:opacity protein-like surface antigen